MIALVMELVEGPTLADRIARGPIPIDEALQIAAQIAEALESAHEQRVIHRDLKPANIKLRPDGTVKVLDFGLAKALEPTPDVSASLSHSPTITTAMTQPGVILGTAAYMAPEQARGALSTSAPISGPSVACCTKCWPAGRPSVRQLSVRRSRGSSKGVRTWMHCRPRLLWRFVVSFAAVWNARCAPACNTSEMPSLTSLMFGLVNRLSRGSRHDRDPSRPRDHLGSRVDRAGDARRGRCVAPVVATCPGRDGCSPIRFDVQRVQREPLGVTTRHMALSPDGTRLAYATVSSLRLRAMGGEDVPLPETGTGPFFSPDNQWLAFFSNEGLKRLPVGGGASEPITPATGTERVFGGTWGADGTIVISLGGRLLQVSAKGGPIQPVAEPDAARGEVRFAWPEFLPDGRTVLFTILGAGGAADARIAVLDLALAGRPMFCKADMPHAICGRDTSCMRVKDGFTSSRSMSERYRLAVSRSRSRA